MIKYILFLLVFIPACENVEDVSNELNKLKNTRDILKNEVSILRKNKTKFKTLQKRYLKLNKEIDAIMSSDKIPLYILEIRSSKSSFTLNVRQHVKDFVNSFTFKLPVDKSLFDSVKIGDKLVNKRMNGSLIFSSKIGSVSLTVINKEIKVRN